MFSGFNNGNRSMHIGGYYVENRNQKSENYSKWISNLVRLDRLYKTQCLRCNFVKVILLTLLRIIQERCWFWLFQQLFGLTGKSFTVIPRQVSVSEIQIDFPLSQLAIGDLPPLPAFQWTIAVSNDGLLFSSSVAVFVFDSLCISCSGNTSDTCSRKASWTLESYLLCCCSSCFVNIIDTCWLTGWPTVWLSDWTEQMLYDAYLEREVFESSTRLWSLCAKMTVCSAVQLNMLCVNYRLERVWSAANVMPMVHLTTTTNRRCAM